jgi:TetR/AcrR family transcriptional regulator
MPNAKAVRTSATRRRGTETSETRSALLDVTEALMLEEGYAAVSSRRIAAEVGVTAALIHYYFRTLDDLFIACTGAARTATSTVSRSPCRAPTSPSGSSGSTT